MPKYHLLAGDTYIYIYRERERERIERTWRRKNY